MRQNSDKILDELLILRIKEGDSKSLNLFVKRWHTKLIWYSFQTLHDEDEAKDTVQDCWQTIIKGIQNLQNPSSYKSWMYRVIRNKSIDKIRETKRKNKAEENLIVDSIYQEEFKEPISEVEIMEKLIHGLPIELREILQLFYLETQSINDISKMLSIPLGTVKSRLFRAREQLKSEFIKTKKRIKY